MASPQHIWFFMWLVAHDKIPTNDPCYHRQISHTSVCPRCDASPELNLNTLRLERLCLFKNNLDSYFKIKKAWWVSSRRPYSLDNL